MAEAYERFAATDEGANSDVYPALATVSRHLFGVCVAGIDMPSTRSRS
jgi:glutaminase